MERYSEDNPISTKVKILILESYYITNFSDSGIDLYNSENTLREFLNGNKIPTEGNTLIFAIIHTFANFTIKECDGVLYFDKRNILKNKPEQFMREQLIQYLTDHMPYTFIGERELGQSKRKLDIYFDVRGDLYFIEIKWLGISINDRGTGLSSEHADFRARAGVTQTLEYLEELMNSSEKGWRHGYLVIYDARDIKKEINFQNYEFVREELRRYKQYFSVLKIISLEKRHPA